MQPEVMFYKPIMVGYVQAHGQSYPSRAISGLTTYDRKPDNPSELQYFYRRPVMEILLQIWGGACYLLNKVCFSLAERSTTRDRNRSWRLWSWGIYLAGLPAWVVVFISEHNWIAATVESGGAPAMTIGFIIALRGHGTEPRWLDYLARFSVVIGLVLSFYEFGGITTLTQVFELCIAAGFLMGTYLMAKDRIHGYFWLMLGNVSCSALMGIEGYYILMLQQAVSLFFVVDAYRTRHRAASTTSD